MSRGVRLCALAAAVAALLAGLQPAAAETDAESPCDSDAVVPNAAGNPGLVADCKALLAAEAALTGTGGRTLNWGDDGVPLDEWHGVEVGNGEPARVVVLQVESAAEGTLRGTIPERLGDLTALQVLTLTGNALTGSIPQALGSLSELKTLELDGNDLTGAIPAELGDLPQLAVLNLADNRLTGAIPTALGSAPVFILTLSGNELSGAIPSWIGTRGWTQLRLDDNDLTGPIPAWTVAPSVPKFFALDGNRLSGCIPEVLAGLKRRINPQQQSMNLPVCPTVSVADASGDEGDVVRFAVTLTRQAGADVTVTWHTTDGTAGVDDYTAVTAGTLTIPAGQTTGTLTVTTAFDDEAEEPETFSVTLDSAIAAGHALTLRHATATGTIQEGICHRTPEVREAILGAIRGISECGEVTADHLAGVRALRLPSRGIGSLQAGDFQGLSGLTDLILPHNGFTALPDGVFDGLGALQTLILGRNELAMPLAELVAALGDSPRLTHLVLNANRLTGAIPPQVEDFAALTELHLEENRLTGAIPPGIGTLTGLTMLVLNDNQLTGAVPRALENLTAVRQLYLHNNNLRGCTPEGLSDVVIQADTRQRHGASLPWCPTVTVADASADEGGVVAFPVTLDGPPATEAVEVTWHTGADTEGADPAAAGVDYVAVAAGRLTIPRGQPSRTLAVTTVADFDTEGAETFTVTVDAATMAGEPLTIVQATATGTIQEGICRRTPAVRDAIVAAIPGVRNCADVTAEHLARVTSLDLLEKGIASLQAGDFRGLAGLTRLVLAGNGLTGLPAGVFDGLGALRELVLLHNDLALPLADLVAALADSPDLTELHLSGNRLTGAIPPRLQRFGRLTRIHADGNLLDGAIPAALGTLSELTHLALGDNRLDGAIPAELGELTGLTYLGLDGNRLEGAVPRALGRLAALTHLHLEGNDLIACIPEPLAAVQTVMRTQADGSVLPFCPTVAVSDAGAVEGEAVEFTVTLSGPAGDNLTLAWRTADGTAEAGADFRGGAVVQNLRAGQRKATLSVATFADEHRAEGVETFSAVLDWAWVAGQRLTITRATATGSIYDSICRRTLQVRAAIVRAVPGVEHCRDVTAEHLAGVTELRLKRDGIDALRSDDFGGLTGLRELDLSHNELSGLPAGVFGDLGALRELDLSRNELSGLPAGVFDDLGALRELDLSANEGLTLPAGVFAGLAELRSLSLGAIRLQMPLAELLDELAGSPRLTRLGLQANHLSGAIPARVRQFAQLVTLNLTANQLDGAIPKELGELSALRELRLDWNRLTGAIPAELGELSALTELSMEYNQLTGPVPRALAGLPALRTLGLKYNDLVGCIPEPLADLPNLTSRWDDGRPVPFCPTVTVDDYAVIEGGTVRFPVRLSGNAGGEVTITYSTGNGTAVAGADYEAVVGGSAIIPAGRLTGALRVATTRDEVEELIETFTVTVDAARVAGEALVVARAQAQGEIRDGICHRTRAVRVAIVHAIDGVPNCGEVTAEHLAGVTSLDLADREIEALQGSDLEGLTGLTGLDLSGNELSGLPAGVFDDLGALRTLALNGNELDLPLAELVAALAGSPLLTELALHDNRLGGVVPRALERLAALADLTVAGNDLRGCVPETLAGATGARGQRDGSVLPFCPLVSVAGWHAVPGEPVPFTVRLTGPAGGAVTVTWRTEDGSATAGVDYDAVAAGTVVVPADETEATFTVPTRPADAEEFPPITFRAVLTGAVEEHGSVLTLEPADGGGAAVGRIVEACLNGVTVPNPDFQPDLVSDCRALLAARDVLQGDGAGLTGSDGQRRLRPPWTADHYVGSWRGITVRSGRVTGLSLDGQSFTPTVSGSIPPVLGRLGALERLRIVTSSMTGGIPKELGQLRELKRLILFGFDSAEPGMTGLTGAIPRELGRLANLELLNLDGNRLSGPIPRELGTLSKLRTFSAVYNHLSGPLPEEIGDLTELRVLRLQENGLSGPFPARVRELRKLDQVSLTNNQLSGEFPWFLFGTLLTIDQGGLPKSRVSSLVNNLFTGSVPVDADLARAIAASLYGGRYITMHDNRLSGCVPLFMRGESIGARHQRDEAGTRVILPLCKAEASLPEVLGVIEGAGDRRVTVQVAPAVLTVIDVGYEARPGSAQPGDYAAARGAVRFDYAETERPAALAVVDDELPEHDETFTVVLTGIALPGLDDLTPEERADVITLDEDATILTVTIFDDDPPVFVSPDSFPVAAGRTAVGLVKARGADSREAITYAIDGGADAAQFVIDADSGLLSLTTAAARQPGHEFAVTVTATRELPGVDGGPARVLTARQPVTARVIAGCSNGTVVPDPEANPGLVGDCEALLDARETLLSDANSDALNWGLNVAIDDWDGVTVDGEPRRVTALQPSTDDEPVALGGAVPGGLDRLDALRILRLAGASLTGAIPARLATLAGLQVLDLGGNELTGAVPAALAGLSGLQELDLGGNELDGTIPGGLAALPALSTLHLGANRLQGLIPLAFGKQRTLTRLTLRDNHLVGCVPVELLLKTSLVLDVDEQRDGVTLPRCPTVSLEARAQTVTEGQDARFDAILSGTVVGDVRIGWHTADGGGDGAATAGVDYTAVADGSAVIAHAAATDRAVLAVATTVDQDEEAAEEFTVTVTEAAVVWRGDALPLHISDPQASVAIVDVDAHCRDGAVVPDPDANPGLVADCEVLLASEAALRGGGPGADALLDWGDQGVAIAAWDGVTVAGDPARVRSLHLPDRKLQGIVPPGLAGLTVLSSLDLARNDLTGPVPAELGGLAELTALVLSRNTLIGCIPDPLADFAATINPQRLAGGDGAPENVAATVDLPLCARTTVVTIADAAADEALGLVELPVSLSAPAGADLTFSWAASPVAGPGAVAIAVDDAAVTDGSLVIPAGDTAGSVAVVVVDDTTVEPDETFTVTLSAEPALPYGVAVDRPSALGTIRNDDAAVISVGPAAAPEGETAAFPVSLTAPVAVDLALSWSTADGEGDGAARAGEDYTAVSAQDLTIPAGETAAVLEVATIRDQVSEDDETFTVTLQAAGALPADVSLGTAQATGTIADVNDAPVIGGDLALTVAEGGQVVLADADLSAGDPDGDDAALRWSVPPGNALGAPSSGHLALAGAPQTAVTGFTMAQVTAGAVIYVHDGSETAADGFAVTVADGDGATDTAEVAVTVTPVNDAPVIGGDLALTVAEGGQVVLADADLSAGDVDGDDAALRWSVPAGDALGAPSSGRVALAGAVETAVTGFTATQLSGGAVIYVHDGSETAADGFAVTVADGDGATDTAEVAVTVTPVNDAPVIGGDLTLAVAEGGRVVLADADLSVADVDDDAAALTWTVPAAGQDGAPAVGHLALADAPETPVTGFTATQLRGGEVLYAHDGSETARDAFTVTVADAAGATDAATLRVVVDGVNEAPRTVADNITILEGGLATALDGGATSVLANDIDAEGDDLKAVLVGGASHGDLTLNADGTFSYAHDGSETTSDDFTYRADEIAAGGEQGSTAQVFITITAVNDAPVTVADAIMVAEGGTATTLADGEDSVLANDTDAEGDDLEAVLVIGVSHGTLKLNPDGRFSYTHDGGEERRDAFTYRADEQGKGGAAGSEVAVTITITAGNDAPVIAGDLALAVAEGGSVALAAADLSASDVDDDDETLSWTVPAAGEDGAPAAGHLALSAAPGTPVTSFTAVQLSDGEVVYVHDGTETESDSFAVTVADDDGATARETIAVTVTAVNDAPVIAGDLALAVAEGGSVALAGADLSASDADDDDETLSWTVPAAGEDGAPAAGHLALSAARETAVTSFTAAQLSAGEVVYVHDGTETESDSFAVTVADDDGATARETIAVTVTAGNDAPAIAGDLALTVPEGGSVALAGADLSASDVDDDDETLSWTVPAAGETGAPAAGHLALSAAPGTAVTSFTAVQLSDGEVVYVHDGTETESDSFAVTVADDDGATAQETIAVTVTAENDAPVIAGDLALAVEEGGSVALAGADLSASDVDDDDETLSWTVPAAGEDGAPAAGHVALADAQATPVTSFTAAQLSDGEVVYVHDGTETVSDSFAVTVADDDGATDVATLTVTVTAVNDAPVITSPTTLSVAENETAVATLTATDADHEVTELEWSIPDGAGGGADAGHFTLTTARELAFDAAKDYETPDDAGTDREYELTVQVTDGHNPVTAALTVTLTDVNEAPSFDAASYAFDLAENAAGDQTAVALGTVTASDPDAGDVPAYAISAGDTSRFALDEDSGALTYVGEGEDFEAELGTYELTVTATDGGSLTATAAVTVTITDVNEAPAAVADAIRVAEGGTATTLADGVTGSVLANDTDPEEDDLKAVVVTDVSHGTLTLNADGTFSYAHNGSETTSDRFTYRADEQGEGGAEGSEATVTITITAVNDAPVIAGDLALAVAEGGSVALAGADLSASDADDDDETLSWTVPAAGEDGAPAAGHLALADALATPVTSFTAAQLSDGEVVYVHDGTETVSDSFAVTVADDAGATDAATVRVTVTAVNDAPVITSPTTLSVAENETAVATLTATDADLGDGEELQWSIPAGTDAGHFTLTAAGELSFRTAKDYETPDDTDTDREYELTVQVTDGHNPVSAALTVTVTNVNEAPSFDAASYAFDLAENVAGDQTAVALGTVTASDPDAGDVPAYAISAGDTSLFALDENSGALTYVGAGEDFEAEPAGYELTVTATDAGSLTATAAVTVTITDVNEAPAAVADAITVAEGGTAAALADGVTGSVLANDTDPEDDDLKAVLVSGPDHGTLTLNADGTFSYAHDGSEDHSDRFIYRADEQGEGGAEGSEATVTITITAVNDAPVIAGDQALAVAEGGSVALAGADLSASDADDDDETLSWTVPAAGEDGAPAAGHLALADALATPVTSFTAVQLSAGEVVYVHDGTETTSDSFAVTVADDAGATDAATVRVTVTAVNDAPVITSPTTLSVAENETAVATLTATDADLGDGEELQWSIPAGVDGGADAGHFTLTTAGELTFRTAKDYETPDDTDTDREYELTVQVTDGHNPVTAALTVTLTDVNEAPSFDAASYAFDLAENVAGDQTAVALGTVTASDPDAGDVPAYAISAGDTSPFALDEDSGALTYVGEGEDFEAELGTYELTVTATDGGSLTATAEVTVTITDVNEAPAAVADAITVAEGGTAAALADGKDSVLANDTDPEEDDLEAVLVTDVGHGTLTLNADGTFSYAHDGSETTSDRFTYRADEQGEGGAEGSEATVTITITAVNDAPVIVGDLALAVAEGGSVALAAADLSASDADDDDETLSWTVPAAGEDGAPAAGHLALSAARETAVTSFTAAQLSAGDVVYVHDGTETESDEFTVTVADDAGATDAATVRVTVTAENDAPVITSPTTLSVAENETAVATLTATDADLGDGEELQWSIPDGAGGGADAGHFTLTAAGVLAFEEAKDYETPDDANTDSEYELTVQVTDGHNAVTAALTVTLTDVVPTVTIAAVAETVAEGDPAQFTVTRSGDENGPLSATVTVSEAGGAMLAADAAGARQVQFSGTAATAQLSAASEDDNVDEPDATVTATVTNGTGYLVGTDNTATVEVTDDEVTPTVTLALSPASITEDGGESTVTAALSGASSEDTTITVTAAAVSPAESDDFELSTNTELTIAAGETESTGTVTITAVNDDLDGPDKEVTVSAAAANDQGVNDPADVTLTISDDEGAPTVTLVLGPASITENGASSTVTATLSGESGGATTITVTAAAVSPAVSGDFELSTNTELTIAAGQTASTGTVTITAVNDDVDGPDKEVTVSAAAANDQGVDGPAAVTLTITDDDAAPEITTAATLPVAENELRVATLAATDADLADGELAWSIPAGLAGGADAGHFALTAAGELTFRAPKDYETPDDDDEDGDYAVTVRVTDGHNPVSADLTVTVTDVDEPPPAPTVLVEPDSSTTLAVTWTTHLVRGTPPVTGHDVRYRVAATETFTAAGLAGAATTETMLTGLEPDTTYEVQVRARNAEGESGWASATGTTLANEPQQVNTAPTTVADRIEVARGGTATTLTGGEDSVLANDTDAQDDDLQAVLVTDVSHGTLTLNADGTFGYTHDGGQTASDAFTYRAVEQGEGGAEGNVATVTITVTDDSGAPPTPEAITLTVDPVSWAEDAGDKEVTVTATIDGEARFGEAVTLTVTVAGSGTEAAVDFAPVDDFTIEIPAGAARGEGSFTLTPIDDAEDESDETVTVAGTATAAAAVTGTALTLIDDDAPPGAIMLTTDVESWAEHMGETAVTVTATIAGATRFPTAMQVQVAVAGMAGSAAVDFMPVDDFMIEIPSGMPSATGSFMLEPIDDAEVEVAETVMVAGTAPVAVMPARVMLMDDDESAPADRQPTSALSIAAAVSVAEGDEGVTQAAFAVTLSPASEQVVAARWATADGTAEAGADYEAASGRLTFEPGETRRTIRVAVLGDEIPEADETFTVALSDAEHAAVGEERTGTATIVDDDEALLSITAAVSVAEGDEGVTQAAFAVTLSPASEQVVTARWATADGTAKAGADYEAASGRLTFEPGDMRRTIRVAVLGDEIPEADETFTVALSDAEHAAVGEERTGTATIVDDDEALLSITAAVSVAEGDEGVTQAAFAVTLSPASEQVVTATWATADGTAEAGADYEAASGRLTFEPGDMRRTIRVAVLGDEIPEADEIFTVTLSDAEHAAVGEERTGTATIVDDDEALLSITAAVSVAEGDEGVTQAAFEVTLSRASEQVVTARWATADGTAEAGADYEAASGRVTFEPGETQRTIGVAVLGDEIPEADEIFTVTLSDPEHAAVGEERTGTATIVDDDEALLSITPAVSVAEGDEGVTQAAFAVTLSGASEQVVTARWATADGTAKAGADYEAASGRVTFEPGETRRTIGVAVLGDEIPEADETFTITLSDPEHAALGEERTGTATIVDDDEALLSITPAVSVAEGDEGVTQAAFAVTLSGASEQVVAATWATADGTAKAGADYEAASGRVTFEPGETRRTIGVAVLGDEIPEADEILTVTLSDAEHAALGEERTGTATIVDDDEALLSITAAVSVAEGDEGVTQAAFAVTLSPASEQVVTARWATADGTAKAGADYEAASGRLTFEPGDMRRTIRVAVLGDEIPEADETFTVALSDAEHAAVGEERTGTATIVDDDEALLSITAAVSVAEGDEGVTQAAFAVTLSPASEQVVTATWATADGTAEAGADYEAASGRLTFEPGDMRRTIRVAVLGDEIPEADEIFTVTLSDAEHAAVGEERTGTATIVDDDEEVVRNQALQASLSALARMVAMDAVDTIGGRFQGALPGSNVNVAGTGLALDEGPGLEVVDDLLVGLLGLNVPSAAAGETGTSGLVHDRRETGLRPLTARPVSSLELLSRSAFDVRLDAPEDEEAGEPSWLLWGRGSRSGYSGPGGEDFVVNGGINTGYVGVERRARDLLLGLALSVNWGDLEYARDGIASGTRAHQYLISALPYGTWSPLDGLGVWGLLGAGLGTIELDDHGETGMNLWLAALGGRYALLAGHGIELAVKTDAVHTLVESGAQGLLRGGGSQVSRLRLLLEGARDWQVADQALLGMSLELGGSWDAGEAVSGMGAEVGGGLEFRHTGLGLGMTARGRYLLIHEERDLHEWGASLMLELDPGRPRQGVRVSLAPEWGNASSSVERLWESDSVERASAFGLGGAADRAAEAQHPWEPDRLNLDVGYGVQQGAVATTWYGGLSTGAEVTWRLGSRVKAGESAYVNLELEMREQSEGLSLHGFGFRTGLSW